MYDIQMQDLETSSGSESCMQLLQFLVSEVEGELSTASANLPRFREMPHFARTPGGNTAARIMLLIS